ncbi:hypothetical protein QR680_005323 [Steinernema hermaphroditum]|uniref:G-protein coupled receptors family 1 profile domain-containing protein n=1 Tax=Steinernema hermaphroditum TaxID=289476 RepID=A0AA39HTT2_9BILA|nr:hypothetical protein QR680_005323 [Steinernema hermaphroditum]
MVAEADFGSLPFAVAIFLQGWLSLLMNVLLALSIVTSASNRVRKQYTVIVGVCLSESLLALSFIVLSVHWIVHLFSNYVPATNRESFQCLSMPYNVLFAVSYQCVGVATLLAAVDRFLSELFPRLYSKLSIVDIGVAIVVGFILSFIPLLAALNFSRTARVDFYSNRPYLYMALDAISDTISPFFVLFRLVTVSASICLALPVLYVENRQQRKLFKTTSKAKTVVTPSASQSSSRQRTWRSSIIGFAIVTSMAFLIVPDALTVTREFSHKDVFLSVYLSNQFRSWLNASVFFAKHGNLRRQLAELFCLVKG